MIMSLTSTSNSPVRVSYIEIEDHISAVQEGYTEKEVNNKFDS